MTGSMLKQSTRLAFTLFVSLVMTGTVSVFAQSANPSATPLLQPIVITKSPTGPQVYVPQGARTAQPTPGVKKIADVRPVMDIPVIPTAGILVEKAAGQQIMENASNYAFNPASNVKLITAFAVLKTFGPNYRFPTNVWSDGVVDSTGTLNGNLYITGRDPAFMMEHGIAIADALNRLGIRQVSGDLIVNSTFAMNYANGAAKAGASLYNVMNTNGRSAAAVKAWQAHSISGGKMATVPNVTISGKVFVEDIIPTNAKVIFAHDSAPLKDILKINLSYSNNYMSEKLGEALGGTENVERINQIEHQIAPEELQLATSSGLGYNRVTPKAMMRVLRGLRNELARYRLKLEDIMPVAGIDPGTLAGRFTGSQAGSVVAKTGTLGNTDGGVSTLVGETKCANGDILFFVIFNQKGSVRPYRNYQNTLVTTLQNNCGGAAPLGYNFMTFSTRMANTRISYPAQRTRNEEEEE